MQQRQLRLGDILDDYCPRERRLTNHAVVAMVGPDVKQTRCTTCDAEHEYKHAKVPRQRRKAESPAALYTQVLASGPKKVVHESVAPEALAPEPAETFADIVEDEASIAVADMEGDEPVTELAAVDEGDDDAELEEGDGGSREVEDGPVHRPLIRAQLPRPEGQPPAARPAPDFTIRQPGGRQNRFRPRHQRGAGGGGGFSGNRSNGNMIGGAMRGGGFNGNRQPPMSSRPAKRHGPGRKRSK